MMIEIITIAPSPDELRPRLTGINCRACDLGLSRRIADGLALDCPERPQMSKQS